MQQPTKSEITEKLNMVLKGTMSRENVSDWAENIIRYDDIKEIEVIDLEAWHYLLAASTISEEIIVDDKIEYFFSNDDILNIINEYDKITK